MTRRLALHPAAVAAALVWLVCVPFAAMAQQAPSDHDLQIYAGLHAAAANGDIAEIEKLIGAGEKPERPGRQQPHPADRRRLPPPV